MLAKAYRKLVALFSPATSNAAHAWQATGSKIAHPYWMYATPVNMALGRDSFFLTDPASVRLSTDESKTLIASLNAHYAGLGYYFYLINDVWFLGLDQDPKIMTTPVEQVKNKDIADYLPQGDGALVWNKLQNEIQMLLFNQSVNHARELQGLPVINSLWCYGLGSL